MKKFIVTFVMTALLAIMLPFAAAAQTRGRQYYAPGVYNGSVYQRPSFYRRHRNAVNIAAGTAGAAVLGGLIGGRRGAGIGALLGAGGAALYTYKIRPKQRRYY